MKIYRTHRTLVASMILMTAFVAGCEQRQATAGSSLDTYLQEKRQEPGADAGSVLALVNGVPITEQAFALFARSRGVDDLSTLPDQDRKVVINNLISLELLYQEGLKTGVPDETDVKEALEAQERLLVAQQVLRTYMTKHPIPDEMVKRTYDEQIKRLDDKEYKARHILVEKEEDAKAIIVRLDEGAEFSALAQEKSIGPSAKNGGDLGWFSPNTMVKPFSDAVSKMDKGTYTKVPVQTQFGWHVILLEDVRGVTPKPYEEVKDELTKQLQRQQINDYQATLRGQANVELK